VKEDAHDAVLFCSAFGTCPIEKAQARRPSDFLLKNPANTNVLLWGSRLFALWEVRLACCRQIPRGFVQELPGYVVRLRDIWTIISGKEEGVRYASLVSELGQHWTMSCGFELCPGAWV
jgi:hypothetical protein